MKISLICATYNRSTELEQLLNSLVTQTYKNFEIILVDQNKNGLIDEICKNYKLQLNLIQIKSNRLGLSTNRNLGIQAATGEILGFPDDDCTYYPDTLGHVNTQFNNLRVSIIYGRIYDRNRQINIMRNWPSKAHDIESILNIIKYSSSIVIFVNKNNYTTFFFDEVFGINQQFGSCEDIELCYRMFCKGAQLTYTPNIMVNHPDVISVFLDPKKAYNYSLGWGAFFAKHWSLKIAPAFFGIYFFVIAKTFRDLLFLKPTTKGRVYSLVGRIAGFIKYQITYKLGGKNVN